MNGQWAAMKSSFSPPLASLAYLLSYMSTATRSTDCWKAFSILMFNIYNSCTLCRILTLLLCCYTPKSILYFRSLSLFQKNNSQSLFSKLLQVLLILSSPTHWAPVAIIVPNPDKGYFYQTKSSQILTRDIFYQIKSS